MTAEPRIITTTDDLAAFCELAKAQPYVTLDTEFLRERTYYSKLCLIQMALPPASRSTTITWGSAARTGLRPPARKSK